MAFDLATWKKQAAERLRGFRREAASRAPGSIYATLCAISIWPAIQAAQTGDFGAAAAAAFGVAANVGANLIANNFQKWKDEAEAAKALEAEAAKDAETRKALDKILAEVEAPREAQASLSEADKKWFVDALLKEVKTLGSTLNVTINTGGGAYVAANVSVKGDFVGRDKIIHTLVESLTIVTGKTDPNEERGWLESYLRSIIKDCSGLNLQAIAESAAHADRDGARREPPRLSDVYVDLNTQLRISRDIATLADHFKRPKDTPDGKVPGQRDDIGLQLRDDKTRSVSVLEAFAHHRKMVLLGKPGSGKSTFASYVSLILARAAMGDSYGLVAFGERWTHGVLLPIQVALRKFAQFLAKSDSEGNAGDLWRFIRAEIENELGPHEATLVEQLAKRVGALFVFDGLDEASTSDLRIRVLAAVNDFNGNAHARSRFLITARPYAWGTPEPIRGEYAVASFDTDQIRTFVQRWYDALVAWRWLDQDDADEKRDSLLPACERSDLRPLAENPLLLTLMATLTANGIKLPDARAELYATMVELLMNRWNQRFGKEQPLVQQLAVPGLSIANLRGVLEEIAFAAHKAHEGRAGTADIEAWDLLQAFEKLLGSLDKARLVVNYIDDRAGLLIALGERKLDGAGKSKYAFPHRTFQEFLAGCYLARQIDFNERVYALAGTNAAHWRLALTFAASRANTERGSSAADALVHSEQRNFSQDAPAVSVDDGWRAMIAADQLLELGLPEVNRSEQGRKIKHRVATWLAGAMRGALQPKERAEAGRLAAQLGDPCRGVLTVDDMPMCYVPPGEFIMGGKGEYDGKPEHLQKVMDGFWISQYPITNAQFELFVGEQGYSTKEFWAEAIAAKRWEAGRFHDRRDEWRSAPRPYGLPYTLANHPVVGVSWYEALAFMRWLRQRLQRECWLPSEAQWEYGARGPRYGPKTITPLVRTAKTLGEVTERALQDFAGDIGQSKASPDNERTYPWGEGADPQKMNFAETGIGATSAAGAFPAGVSVFGCEDMSGNVWEWTLTKKTDDYEDYDRKVDNRTDGSEVRRVLRGGAFYNDGSGVRCACRPGGAVDRAANDIGFRVVASPIPM